MAGNETENNYEVVLAEEAPNTVEVAELQNTVTVDAEDPSLVYVTVGGVATNQTSLLQVWGYPEEIRVKVGQGRFYVPVRAAVLGVSATIDTPPEGGDIVIDLNRNFVSMFADPADQPVITDGQNLAAEVTVFADPLIEAGDILTVDIDEVGSVQPGRDLTVTVRYRLQ